MLNRRSETTSRTRRRVYLALLGFLGLLGGSAYWIYGVQTPPATLQVSAPPITAKLPGRVQRGAVRLGYAQAQAGVRAQCPPEGSRRARCASRTPSPTPPAEGGNPFQGGAPGTSGGRLPSPPTPSGSPPRALSRPSSRSFSIREEGIAGGPLHPGAGPQAIRLTLGNPNGVPIFVTRLSTAVRGGSAGCDSAENISLGQASVSSAAPLEIKAHGSVTLPAQGHSAPTIQLVDLPVNQDACQNARFPLSFTGSAHS